MSKTKKATSAKKKEAEPKEGAKHSLHNLYDEYNSYIRANDFYKQEIKYLQKRLEDVAKRNTDKEIMAQVEQFQNQFIVLKEDVDVLNKEVKAGLKIVEKQINKKPTHADEKTITVENPHSKKFHSLEKDFAGERLRFNKFLSKYL